MRFVERPSGRARLPVREIAASPPRQVQYQLAQQATLATRPDKTTDRSLAAARTDWVARGSRGTAPCPFAREAGVTKVVAATVGHHTSTTELSNEQVGQLAAQPVATVAVPLNLDPLPHSGGCAPADRLELSSGRRHQEPLQRRWRWRVAGLI